MQRECKSTRTRARSRYGLAALAALVVGLFAIMAAPGSALAAPGSITGQVTDASTGNPIPFAEACLYTSPVEVFETCEETDLLGEYEIEAEEGEYKVEFFAFGYVTQWFEAKPSYATADPVEIEAGNVTEEINAEMVEEVPPVEPYGQITGKATDATNGSAIKGIEVCAESTSNEFGGGCEETDSNGEYDLFVHSGSYAVEFYSPRKYNENPPYNEEGLKGPNYVAQWYNGKAHRLEADSVSVSDESTTSGINASMQPGATITGTVVDAVTSAALQGIDVCAWNAAWGFECNLTDANGNYAIPTLPTGAYKVEFQPDYFFIAKPEEGKEYWQRTDFPLDEYLRQYWNNRFSFATAEIVNATGGATVPGINARMTKEFEAGIATVGPKAKVKGKKALLQVSCAPGPCSGVIKLSAKWKPKPKPKKKKGKRNHKKGGKTVLIGKANFSIPANTSAVVRVRLNSKGLQLLGEKKKGLKATVAGTGVAKGKVTLKGHVKKKKKGKKKGHHKKGHH